MCICSFSLQPLEERIHIVFLFFLLLLCNVLRGVETDRDRDEGVGRKKKEIKKRGDVR